MATVELSAPGLSPVTLNTTSLGLRNTFIFGMDETDLLLGGILEADFCGGVALMAGSSSFFRVSANEFDFFGSVDDETGAGAAIGADTTIDSTFFERGVTDTVVGASVDLDFFGFFSVAVCFDFGDRECFAETADVGEPERAWRSALVFIFLSSFFLDDVDESFFKEAGEGGFGEGDLLEKGDEEELVVVGEPELLHMLLAVGRCALAVEVAIVGVSMLGCSASSVAIAASTLPNSARRCASS